MNCQSCQTKYEHRHLACLEVSSHLMKAVFGDTPAGYWVRVRGGVPDDAKLASLSLDPERNCYIFVYESQSFPAVADCALITHRIQPTIQSLFIPE